MASRSGGPQYQPISAALRDGMLLGDTRHRLRALGERSGPCKLCKRTSVVAGLGLPDHSPFSRRGAISLLIIAAHAALIYGFATAFVHGTVKLPTPTQGVMYPPTPVHHEQLPILHLSNSLGTAEEPKLGKLDPIDIHFPTDDPQGGLENTPATEGQQGPAQIPVHPTRVIGGPGPGFPRTDDYYPAAARRLRGNGTGHGSRVRR